MAFNKKTLFVVGAGASLPYGYPLGDELVACIVKDKESSQELKDLITFYDPFSIDSFLAQHCHNNEALTTEGKRLIAKHILECEDRDALAGRGKQWGMDEQKKRVRGNANWYRFLVNHLFDKLTPSLEIKREETAKRLQWVKDFELPFRIITFNYDVSLDYYILERIWKAPLLLEAEKRELLKKLQQSIVHVYGSVREVPWDKPEVLNDYYINHCKKMGTYHISRKRIDDVYDTESEKELMPYVYGSHHKAISANYNYSDRIRGITDTEHGKEFVAQAAKRLKVIHERNEEVKEALIPFQRFMIKDAERITFLGFGFDDENMKLLFPEPLMNYLKADIVGFGSNLLERLDQEDKQYMLEMMKDISDEEQKKIMQKRIDLQYVNYQDSEKLNRKMIFQFPGILEPFISNKNQGNKRFIHLKSIKSVYGALTEDFDL